MAKLIHRKKEAVVRAIDPKDLVTMLKKLNVKAKAGADVFSLGADPTPADITGFIRTGCYALDVCMGQDGLVGGVPLGRILEVYGPESTGKSTWLYSMLAATQRGDGCSIKHVRDAAGNFRTEVKEPTLPPGIAVLIDTEETFEKSRAQRIGIDLDTMIHICVDTVNEAFERIEDFMDELAASKYRDTPVMIGYDTIAADPTIAEVKDEAGVADKPRVIRKALRRLTKKIARRRVSLVILNQVMHNIGGAHGGYDSPGGKGLKHHASYRFQMSRMSQLREGDKTVGIVAKVWPVKSKVVPPDFAVQVPIRFVVGIDDAGATLAFLTDKTRWKKCPVETGQWYSFAGERFRSVDWSKLYASNKALREKAQSLVRRNIQDGLKES